MSAKLTTYIIPAGRQLQHLLEIELPAGYYLDSLICTALQVMEVEYERHIWDMVFQDLYSYSLMVCGGEGASDEYSSKVDHDIAMEEATKAERVIHMCISTLKPLMYNALGEDFFNYNTLTQAFIAGGDLALTYEQQPEPATVFQHNRCISPY